MSTISNPSGPVGNHDPKHGSEADNQLRRDRIVGIVMLVIMMMVFGFILWLASLGNGGGEIDSLDYWSIPF